MRLIVLAAGQGFKLDGMNKPLVRDPGARETVLERYVGTYGTATEKVAVVTRRGGRLFIDPFNHVIPLELVPQSATRFEFLKTAGSVEFVTAAGKPTSVTIKVAGLERTVDKRP